MKNLVIGNTSQIARYFPNNDDYVRISSRDIDISSLTNTQWNNVYLCFAEQRTYLAESSESHIRDLFWDTNFTKVKFLVDLLQPISNKIVYYSTAELWNNTSGPVHASDHYCFHENHYTCSKAHISSLLRDKEIYPKVMIVYPFNFNSVHRKGDYLFAKVFLSILHETKITIGDTLFYRDILHPKMVVDETLLSLNAGVDIVVGSGRLSYIDDFIRKLYNRFNLNMDTMVERIDSSSSIYRKCIFYAAKYSQKYQEDKVLDLLTDELKGLQNG